MDDADPPLGVVTVSFNTLDLTALLVWSLYRILDEPNIDLVIVDNGSSDGSAQILAEVSEAGLFHLVANDHNAHHGPALNQAIASLLERPAPPRHVWILDSDVVVSRGDAANVALTAARRLGAAILGERQWDRWNQKNRFELYSLLLDPHQAWRRDGPNFDDGGDPAFRLLEASEAAGQVAGDFPFAADGYVIHRGRGSLANVVATDDRSHPLYEWAVDHHEAHFGGIAGAREAYEVIVRRFRDEVGEVSSRSLIAACLTPRR